MLYVICRLGWLICWFGVIYWPLNAIICKTDLISLCTIAMKFQSINKSPGLQKMWISKECRDASLTKCMYQLALATSVLLHINVQLFFKESGKPAVGSQTQHTGTNNGIIRISLASWSLHPYIIFNWLTFGSDTMFTLPQSSPPPDPPLSLH